MKVMNPDMYRELVYKDKNIMPVNKELILKFDNEHIANDLKNPTRMGYLLTLRALGVFVDKPFKQLTREDFIAFLTGLKTNGYKIKTKNGFRKGFYNESSIILFKIRIKKFFQWMAGMNRYFYPDSVSFMKTTLRNNNNKLPKDMLTEDEIKKMINVCSFIRDKAIIAVLYESGARMSEFLNLKIGDVIEDKYGAKLQISGKTGDRVVRIVNSMPYLKVWLNEHPQKDDPKAHIWLNVSKYAKVRFMEVLTKNGLRSILQRYADLAGVKKHIHPHLYRHSRATFLANHLTEAQMCEFFGWKQGSRMPARYVHLSGRDVDDAVLKAQGIKRKEEDKEGISSLPKPKICKFCKIKNPEGNKYCYKCLRPLDITEIQKMDMIKEALSEYMWEMLMKDPKFAERMKKIEKSKE